MPLINIINYISVAAQFTEVYFYPRALFGLADIRGPFVIMFFVLIFLIVKLKKIVVNRYFFITFGVLIFLSVFNIFYGIDTFPYLIKQILGISVSAGAYYFLLTVNKGEVRGLFDIYLKIALIVAAIGIIQEISYLIHFSWGYDYSYFLPSYWKFVTSEDYMLLRVNSITLEPTGFCYLILPAFFAAVVSFVNFKDVAIKFYDKWQAIIVIMALILTFSSTGYIGVGFAVLLLVINIARKKKYMLISLIVVFLFFIIASVAYYTSLDIRSRLDSNVEFFMGKRDLNTVNLSSTILFTNAIIATRSFMSNPLIGSGLGSHEISFHKFIGDLLRFDTKGLQYRVFQNTADANSLFLRLMSETGLVGLLVVFYFIIRFYLSKKNDTSNYLWVINNAVLIVFIVRLIRGGNYYDGGLFFFFWLYYFSKIKSANLLKESKDIVGK